MKILVRGTNWIGDAVMTVPALKDLRRAFPQASITLHARPAAAAVFQDAEFIDEILPISGGSSKIAGLIGRSREVRRREFDAGIIFTNSVEPAIVQMLGGVRRRFGYATQGRRAFLTDPIPVPPWKATRHEVYFYLDLVENFIKSLGGETRETALDPEPSLTISAERKEAARVFLQQQGVEASAPLIALGVGSTNSRAKRWPAERYAQLADRLSSELGASIILIGSEGDREVATQVLKLAARGLIDLCGRTSVNEAAGILAACDLLIANDMGLAHLAPAVGTETMVIFGPTNDLATRPLSERAEVIRNPVECSPCMLRDCPIDHRCMTGVTVEHVFDRAAARLVQR